VVAAAALLGLSMPDGQRPRGPQPMFDLTPKPIALISPGTVTSTGAPNGWTHLLASSHSRVHSGDVEHLNDTLRHLASFLSSALVLRVEPGPPYRLGEIAFGIAAVIDGKDTVVSSETQEKLGARLNFLERIGLSRAEARLPGLLVAARSETLIVLDAPTQMLRDDRHVNVIFRSGVLLDSQTGDVVVLTWVVDLDGSGGYGGVSSPVAIVPPGCRTDILLHVDAREFVLGMVTEKALAAPGPPQGRTELEMPEEARPAAARRVLSAEDFELLEKTLQMLRKRIAS
jgi:hypothetical protein